MSTICVDKENASSNKSSVLIGKSSLLAVNKSLAVGGGGGGGGHHLMSCHTPNEKQRMIGSVLTPQLKQKCPGLTSVEITNTGKKRAFGANLLNTIASGKTPQLTVSHATPVVNRSKLGSRCHTQLKMQNEVSAAESMVTSDEDLLQVPPVEHCFANKYDDYADMHDYEAIDRLVDEIRVTTAASRARSPIRIYVDNVEQQRAADENGEKNVRKMNKAIRKKESREMRSTIYTLSSINLNDMEMMPPPPPSLVGLMLDDDDLDSLCFA